jgi:hypothetical protein
MHVNGEDDFRTAFAALKWHFCLKVIDDVLTTAHPARLYFGALQVCLKMRALQARADFPEGAKPGSKK